MTVKSKTFSHHYLFLGTGSDMEKLRAQAREFASLLKPDNLINIAETTVTDGKELCVTVWYHD